MMPYMKTEGVSGNIQSTSRSIGEVTVEKIGKSAVFLVDWVHYFM